MMRWRGGRGKRRRERREKWQGFGGQTTEEYGREVGGGGCRHAVENEWAEVVVLYPIKYISS
jgi:hypothetical protein